MRTPLRDLVDEMPRYEGPTLKAETVHAAIDLNLSPERGYIWPEVDRPANAAPGPIQLLTAPGAMGKSAAAKAMASQLRAPYVDLSRLQVGTSTLTGELTKVLGWQQTPAFVADLKAGRASLVLDSTDEAQLAAGRDNFIAFLGDLAWIMSDAAACGQVVLLGRRDAIDTTYLALLELGFDVPVSEVRALSYQAACELISVTLDAKIIANQAYEVHRVHPDPFAALRDAVFKEIACSLDGAMVDSVDWERVAGFLGYPPVVLALAERLAVDNPRHELATGTTGGIAHQKRRQGELLQRIVEDILDRESDKVRQRLGDRLAIGATDPQRQVLYTRDEQTARLLAHTSSSGMLVEMPASLTGSERATYEENIESFVLDHPFLVGESFANVVFSDYVRAWAASSPAQELHAGTRSEFLASLPKVGPFFAHFVHSLNPASADYGTVAEDLVDDVVHSFSLGTPGGHAVYAHRGDVASLLLIADPETDDPDAALVFDVEQVSGVLQLSSPISRFTCFTSHGVVISGSNGSVELGPEVAVIADAIDIQSNALVALGSVKSGAPANVMLSAATVQHDADLRVSSFPEKTLLVSWPDAWHQWKPWIVKLPTSDVRLTSSNSSQILLGLRRILTGFGSSVTADPSVLGEKIERFSIGANPVFRAVFDALLNLGVVSKAGPLYKLRLQELGKYGVSWAAMRDDPAHALAKLHLAVARDGALDQLRE